MGLGQELPQLPTARLVPALFAGRLAVDQETDLSVVKKRRIANSRPYSKRKAVNWVQRTVAMA